MDTYVRMTPEGLVEHGVIDNDDYITKDRFVRWITSESKEFFEYGGMYLMKLLTQKEMLVIRGEERHYSIVVFRRAEDNRAVYFKAMELSDKVEDGSIDRPEAINQFIDYLWNHCTTSIIRKTTAEEEYKASQEREQQWKEEMVRQAYLLEEDRTVKMTKEDVEKWRSYDRIRNPIPVNWDSRGAPFRI